MIMPQRQVISGVGKPRLIKEMTRTEKYRTGTASQSGTTITGVGTTWNANMVNGLLVFANGIQRLISTVASTTSITVPAGQSGTVSSQAYTIYWFGYDYYQTTGTPTYTSTSIVDTVALPSSLAIGMRITSIQTAAGYAGTLCYAKVTDINTGTKTITVDGWVGGTPTNNQLYTIDGWIADLPRCEKMVEVFDPDLLIQPIYKSKKDVKDYGYKYSATLDYQTFFSPDTAFDMKEILRMDLSGDQKNIILIPHYDVPGIDYNVFLSAPLNISLHPSGIGFQGIIFSFTGKENVAIPPMFNFGGYGTGYGQNYGIQL